MQQLVLIGPVPRAAFEAVEEAVRLLITNGHEDDLVADFRSSGQIFLDLPHGDRPPAILESALTGHELHWLWITDHFVIHGHRSDPPFQALLDHDTATVLVPIDRTDDGEFLRRARAAHEAIRNVDFEIVDRDESPLTVTMPSWAWDILSETLEADARSSAFSADLREQIRDALRTIRID